MVLQEFILFNFWMIKKLLNYYLQFKIVLKIMYNQPNRLLFNRKKLKLKHKKLIHKKKIQNKIKDTKLLS